MNNIYSILKENEEYLGYSVRVDEDKIKVSYPEEKTIIIKESPENREEWVNRAFHLEKQVAKAFNYAPVNFSVSNITSNDKIHEYFRLSFALFLNNGNPCYQKFLLYYHMDCFVDIDHDFFIEMYEQNLFKEIELPEKNNFQEILVKFIPKIKDTISSYILKISELPNESELRKKLKELEYLYYGINSKDLRIYGFGNENIKLMPDKIKATQMKRY